MDFNDIKWSTLINSQLQNYGGLKFIMQCNFEKGIFDEIPEFYKDNKIF